MDRAREQVAQVGDCAVANAYNKLPAYLRQFEAMNSGSTAVMETDSSGHFERLLVAPKVFWSAVGAREPVLGIDCAHSKCPGYTGA